MKSYDFDAVVYNDEVYCVEHLPEGVNIETDDVKPVFASDEWDFFPACEVCGKMHDYVGLTDAGLDWAWDSYGDEFMTELGYEREEDTDV